MRAPKRLVQRASVLTFASALASTACGFGLFQTARTERPGTVTGHSGTTVVHNAVTRDPERDALAWGVDSGLRLGLADHVDVGLRSFLLSGMQTDLKLNVLSPTDDLALAARVGGGYAARYETYNALAGVIGSYRVLRDLEPYVGVTFSNFWIMDYGEPEIPRDSTETYVDRSGTGDGLLKLVIGVQATLSAYTALMLEAGHWIPLNNDPGDFYAFVPTTVFGLGVRFGMLDPARAAEQRRNEELERQREQTEEIWERELELEREERERWEYRPGPALPPAPGSNRPKRLDPTGPTPPPRSPTGPSRPL